MMRSRHVPFLLQNAEDGLEGDILRSIESNLYIRVVIADALRLVNSNYMRLELAKTAPSKNAF